MVKKIKKGFTLTELIVVIAIIAILAAVLIPTSISFIKKAKISADTQEAAGMNRFLASEAVFDDVSFYTSLEVKNLLKEQGYDLKPSLKNYSYWYDRNTNKVIYGETNELITEVISAANANSTSRNCIEALSVANPSLLYISEADNELTKLVNTINNLVELSIEDSSVVNTATVLSTMNSLFNNTKKEVKAKYPELETFVTEFSPSKAIYVHESGYYTSNPNINKENQTIEISQVIFSKSVVTIDTFNIGEGTVLDIKTELVIPSTIQIVEAGALTAHISVTNKVIVTGNTYLEVGSVKDETISVNKSNVVELGPSDYELSYESEKYEYLLTNGTTVNKKPTDETIIVSKYIIPTIKILDSTNGGSLSLGTMKSCIAKSRVDSGAVRITVVVFTTSGIYKVDNIGYITRMGFSCFTNTKIVSTVNGNEIVVSVDVLEKVNCSLSEYSKKLSNIQNMKMEIVYKPGYTLYEAKQDFTSTIMPYISKLVSYNWMETLQTKETKLSDIQKLENIYSLLLNDTYKITINENEYMMNDVQIQEVSIISQDIVIFEQYF